MVTWPALATFTRLAPTNSRSRKASRSFLAGSHSVKADALDFTGDGVISFLGLIAVGWGLAARAKAALLQGIFLGVLGAGVLGATAYRVLVHHQPEARLMVAGRPQRRHRQRRGRDRRPPSCLDADAVARPGRCGRHCRSVSAVVLLDHKHDLSQATRPAGSERS
jgi:hypothetical protein